MVVEAIRALRPVKKGAGQSLSFWSVELIGSGDPPRSSEKVQ